jgi:DNA-binding response OmpR family regulator
MTGKIKSTPLQVGDIQFDARVRSLTVGGQRTLLDSRSCSVFIALAEQAGDCVSKEDLMRTAWPNRLVHENSLAKAISKLRRALGGSDLEIVAAYGVGYILRDNIDLSPQIPEVPRGHPPANTTKPLRPRYSVAAVAAATFLVLLATAAAIMAFSASQQAVANRNTPPITHDAADAVATILWVDDHPSNNRLEIADLKQRHIAVHLAESTEDALKLVAMNRYPLLISDLGRGEDRLAGLKMIEAMRQHGITVPVIIYTIRPKDRAGQEAQRRLVADAGAVELAVTPEQVRAGVLERLAPST